MSNYEQKNGTGTAFKNEKYVQGGNQPYAKGSFLDLNGNRYDIAIWIPKSDKVKGFNLTVSEPYKKEETNHPKSISEEAGDDLPF